MSALHEIAAARLAATGNRYTAARKALVTLLSRAGRPLAVEEILGGSELPRGSIYRNLGLLQESGVVHSISGHDDFTRYELDEGLIGHHHHFACLACGGVTDFELPEQLESELNVSMDSIAAQAHFRPSSHRFDILGICARCGN